MVTPASPLVARVIESEGRLFDGMRELAVAHPAQVAAAHLIRPVGLLAGNLPEIGAGTTRARILSMVCRITSGSNGLAKGVRRDEQDGSGNGEAAHGVLDTQFLSRVAVVNVGELAQRPHPTLAPSSANM